MGARRKRKTPKMNDRQVRVAGRWAGYKSEPKEVPQDILWDGQGSEWLRGYGEGLAHRELCKTESINDPAE